MPALQVRDFPDALYEELKASARRAHRSVAQQTIVAVEDYVSDKGRGPSVTALADSRPAYPAHLRVETNQVRYDNLPEPTPWQRRRRLLEELYSETTPYDMPSDFPDPVALVREDRDSR